MRLRKDRLAIFAGAFLITLTIYYSYGLFSPPKDDFHTQFFTQGYNFRKYQAGDKDFASYRIGEKIDLASLRTSDGNQLLSTVEESLLLFVVIAPRCPFCEMSKDIMGEVKQTADQLKIAYYPVLFSPNHSNANLKEYARSIGFADCFRWDNAPEKFMSMPTPAHILVNRKGIILQVWFSSNKDEKIRKLMSEQISSDLSLINDVSNAVPKVEN